MENYIKFFQDIRLSDVAETGGKGSNLGELASAGFLVPPGFCVTVSGFDTFLSFNNLEEPIAVISNSIDFSQIDDVDEKTGQIRELIQNACIPDQIQQEIATAYVELQGNGEEPLVAVRSSVGTRDLSQASHQMSGLQSPSVHRVK